MIFLAFKTPLHTDGVIRSQLENSFYSLHLTSAIFGRRGE
jgi:hypothetical protein